MVWMMNFLLTNDDGIAAPGLWAAAQVLSEYGSVFVVAPADNYSGYGAALPASQTLTYSACHEYERMLDNVTAFALSATPATCAQVGLSGVFGHGPFDLLVSGVNAGANMGRDVLYSGTVGAALTAQLLGVPSIAVSLDTHPNEAIHWDAAEWGLREALEMWLKQESAKPIVLNVNAPNLPASAISGTRLATLGMNSFLSTYRFEHDSLYASALMVVPNGTGRMVEPDPLTDEWAVAHGYVSITPMQPFAELLRGVPLGAGAVPSALSATHHPLPAPARAPYEFQHVPDLVINTATDMGYGAQQP